MDAAHSTLTDVGCSWCDGLWNSCSGGGMFCRWVCSRSISTRSWFSWSDLDVEAMRLLQIDINMFQQNRSEKKSYFLISRIPGLKFFLPDAVQIRFALWGRQSLNTLSPMPFWLKIDDKPQGQLSPAKKQNKKKLMHTHQRFKGQLSFSNTAQNLKWRAPLCAAPGIKEKDRYLIWNVSCDG